jgi:hypothetical protein
MDKQWLKDQITKVIEMFDDQIPIVGKAMDLPIVDEIEKEIVNQVVDYMWSANIKDNDTMYWSC